MRLGEAQTKRGIPTDVVIYP